MRLSEHKITEVRSGVVRNSWPRLVGRNARLPEHGYGCQNHIVILRTDTGFVGWGVGHADRTLQLLLEGKTVADVFAPEIGILNAAARAADIALHDLAGKILNLPVSKMLNPESTMRVRCYDGAIYMDDLNAAGDLGTAKIIEQCHADYAIGYRDFKIKVGRGAMWMDSDAGFARDVEVVRAVHETFPEATIFVDANDGMDLETARQFVKEIKDCNLYWFEEPFVENRRDCSALKDYLRHECPGTLLADGEFEYWKGEVIDLARDGVVDVLLMDIESYGFTAWRRLMERYQPGGTRFSPHCWGAGMKTRVTAHLAAAFPAACPVIEGVPDITEGVEDKGYTLDEGWLCIAERPGFGMELEYAAPAEVFRPY